MYVDKNVYHGELSAFFKSDKEREEAKNFLLKALIELYDKNISGYLEVTTEGYPGIIVYMDTERGPAFEVTVRHLLEAAAKGEIDYLRGITENVIVGQVIPLGTGMVDLYMRIGRRGEK